MKITHIENVQAFFDVIDSCKGTVELVSPEGDRLNLKSKLTQFVSLSKLFGDAIIHELELIAHEPEDVKKLVDFMMQSK